MKFFEKFGGKKEEGGLGKKEAILIAGLAAAAAANAQDKPKDNFTIDPAGQKIEVTAETAAPSKAYNIADRFKAGVEKPGSISIFPDNGERIYLSKEDIEYIKSQDPSLDLTGSQVRPGLNGDGELDTDPSDSVVLKRDASNKIWSILNHKKMEKERKAQEERSKRGF